MKSRIVLALLAALGTSPVMSADQSIFFDGYGSSSHVGSGVYWGFDLGQSTFSVDQQGLDGQLTDALTDSGLDVLGISSDASEDNFSWGITLGYQIIRYLAVEAAYVDLGEAEYKYNAQVTDGVSSADLGTRVVGDSAGPTLSVLGILPLGHGWDVYARAGMYFGSDDTSVDASVDDVSAAFSDSSSSESFLWGGGLAYTRGRWTARLDYQQFTDVGDEDGFGEVDVDRITLGGVYRTDFGF